MIRPPLSPELRQQARALYLSINSTRKVASQLGLSANTVMSWCRIERWAHAAADTHPVTQPHAPPTTTHAPAELAVRTTIRRPGTSRAREVLADAVEKLAGRTAECPDLGLATQALDRVARAGKNLELWSGANSIVEASLSVLYEQGCLLKAAEEIATIDAPPAEFPTKEEN